MPLCLNCVLKVSPFLLHEVTPTLHRHAAKKMGHRVFSYLDDIFCVAKQTLTTNATPYNTQILEADLKNLCQFLGTRFHPTKNDFTSRGDSKYWEFCSTPRNNNSFSVPNASWMSQNPPCASSKTPNKTDRSCPRIKSNASRAWKTLSSQYWSVSGCACEKCSTLWW